MTLNRKQELLTLLKQSKEAINGQSLAEHFGVTRQIIVKILHFCEQMVLKLSQLTGVTFIRLVMIILMHIDCLK
ncbi:MAG: HTH domain-containing protein [Streptococcus salivarius]